jgi:hypothetical protein
LPGISNLKPNPTSEGATQLDECFVQEEEEEKKRIFFFLSRAAIRVKCIGLLLFPF